MKVEPVLIHGVVHRLVTFSDGHMTISCDSAYDNDGLSPENDMVHTDLPLTCFPCIVMDWRAATYKMPTVTSQMSSRNNSP